MKQIIVVIIVVLFASCGANSKDTKKSSKEMSTTINNIDIHNNWNLTKMLEKDVKNIQLEFNTTENKFYGTDGCNNISGAITKLDDNAIALGEIMSTRMACEDMETPAEYQKLLKQVKQYKIEDSNLYLLDADTKTLLTFKKID